MPYQTVISPCYSCNLPTCSVCANRMYAREFIITDEMVENLWRENVDIVWEENADGELILSQPWRGFPAGEFTQEDWFQWVDDHHSKGVGWVYENISPYDFEKGSD